MHLQTREKKVCGTHRNVFMYVSCAVVQKFVFPCSQIAIINPRFKLMILRTECFRYLMP